MLEVDFFFVLCVFFYNRYLILRWMLDGYVVIDF